MVATLAGGISAGAGGAFANTCEKAEFESAVEEAAKSLRELNQRNKQPFQDKLRALKTKNGWSDEQFMKNAAIYVQDGRIAALDARSGDLLGRINRMGATGAAGTEPDCAMLTDLRAAMKQLVDTQVEKWTYMFDKLEVALKP